ncbi:MAG: hypothetical protein II194_08790 [Bacteroidales bacterium]|nr:hypothetical protein [Bacteroidales bacterium]MBQ2113298.1 hypothetical protein [Bacteroidales bacterium]
MKRLSVHRLTAEAYQCPSAVVISIEPEQILCDSVAGGHELLEEEQDWGFEW